MTVTHVADALSALIGAGIIFVGLRFLLVPRPAAAAYGVAVRPDVGGASAFLAVKAVRDIGSGLITFALLFGAGPAALGWFMLAAAVIPVGDMLIVLRYQGPKAVAYGIHGATAVVMVVIAGLLLSQ
jgi:hypothetical protein